MTEKETRQTIKILMHSPNASLDHKIERAFQTAKQVGSSWPSKQINLIYLGHSKYCEPEDRYRIVIE